jgi:hypothetical protein
VLNFKNAPQRVRDKLNTIEAALCDSIMGEVKYDELDAKINQIRLLELLPDRWTEEIRCELRIAALDKGPAYEALSYVWGNPQDTVEITVNGAPFKATRNLTAALRRLRSSRDSRTLWADAICIYSYRTATKCCRNLRFRPQFCEGFSFASHCLDSVKYEKVLRFVTLCNAAQ